jgi:hypothetical protein
LTVKNNEHERCKKIEELNTLVSTGKSKVAMLVIKGTAEKSVTESICHQSKPTHHATRGTRKKNTLSDMLRISTSFREEEIPLLR